ncbi:nickel transporter [Herbiconiux moechotypicola]|uniref:Nickel/cobalt efflux system n=1 Tax=Herbiconiux moechotypicola TaxID=637393 RepID=A0ABN3D9W6_9MICO|nr:nickel transporter [Herbiconiux moechotypicola]MCS5729024.1 nickel transporter [Herbiconiux moechotypicola]
MTVALSALVRTEGRAALPQRVRVVATLAVVVLLHLGGFAFLLLAGPALAPLFAVAVIAYGRGLIHALDFDHVSMIDNSIRKFVAEGRRPVSVGLAFSAGHSTVVLITSALVIAGFAAVTAALEPDSPVAAVLGVIGLSVSGAYLLLCALANLPRLVEGVRAYRRFPELTEAERESALRPGGGLMSRAMGAPLRWVRHPRHVYLLGFAFSLGFDTSSQIGLLVIVAGATVSGAPPLALMALPLLFTAAITLVDTLNGMFMLRLYGTTAVPERRMLGWNIAITTIGVVAALVVAGLALAELSATFGWTALSDATAWIDTEWAGFGLVAVFLAIGVVVLVGLRSRSRRLARS